MRKAAMQNNTVVISLAGRDKNCRFLVLGNEGDCLILADGKMRPLEHPKKKNRRHVAQTNLMIPPERVTTNKALRLSLAETYAMIGKGGL